MARRLIRNKSLLRDGIVLALYLLLALALTYPLVVHLTSHIPGHETDGPAQTWSLWWVKFSLLNLGASPLSTDYVFYPLGMNLVAYTPTFLNGVLSIPLQLVFGVIVAQNLIVYFSLVVGGFGAYLLTRQVLAMREAGPEPRRRVRVAAVLAGAFYAVGAWHVNYVVAGHFMLLSNEWIPFYALYLLRVDRRDWRNGAWAGLFLALSAWTELTFVLLLGVLTALYLVYQGVRLGRARAARLPVHWRPLLLNVVVLGTVGAIGISPLALNLLADTLRYGYYLAPGMGRVQIFSAEPISFFLPSAAHPLLGAWASGITNANTSYAFIGYAVLILAGLGIYSARAVRGVHFWTAAAALFALVMFGPTLIVGEQSTGIPMPFAALRAVPFANANRYPVRFNAMLMLALVPLVGLGAARLLSARRGTAVLSGLVGLLVFEQAVFPIPLTDLRAPAFFQTLRDEPGDFAVLDLPLGWRGSVAMQGKLDDRAQFFQTVHQKRILGGITSRVPPFKLRYFLEAPVINSLIALETGREVDDVRVAQDREAAPAVLRFFDIRYVEVQRALTDPQVLQYALDVLPLREVYRDDTRTVYRIRETPAATCGVDLHDETARLYFDDAWGRVQTAPNDAYQPVSARSAADAAPELAYRWATSGDAHLWLPLTKAEHDLTLLLRGAQAQQKIAVEVNGRRLAEWTAGTTWDNYTLHVPAEVLGPGLADLRFATETVPLQAVHADPYTIGDTGVVSPVDIAATGAGFDAGRFGEVFVAGKSVIPSQRGYHLVAIDPRSGAVDRVGSFDTFAGVAESTRLAEFVLALPPGEIVAGVGIDEVSRSLQPAAIEAFHALGVEGDLRSQFRAGHAFIGVKGAAPGQALERIDGRWPANVAAGKDVAGDRVALALAGISCER